MPDPDYEKFDALFDKEEHEEEYKLLMEIYKGNEDNVEFLWRLARALYYRSVNDKKKFKDRLYEGQKFALHGHDLSPQHFECLHWAAIITGSIADTSGHREKIQQGHTFKKLLDKALAIKPDEYTLLYLSGRFAFSVANLSWMERKMGSALYGTLPEATMEEAIDKFARIKKLRPNWIENILYYVKAMIAKDARGLKEQIAKELKEAVLMSPENIEEEQSLDELKTLAKKYMK